MKVKIGTMISYGSIVGWSIINSEDEPIMLTLTPEEKELISNMGDQTKLCVYPENCDPTEIRKFMMEGEQ